MKFADILKDLLKENGITQARLASAIGFSQRAISKWVNAQAEPTETAITACAQFFGVSADEILGIDPLASNTLPKEQNNLLKIYENCSEKKKEQILAYANFIYNAPEND